MLIIEGYYSHLTLVELHIAEVTIGYIVELTIGLYQQKLLIMY